MNDQSREFFDKAYAKLSEANKELYRPEEDIVSFLVCKNAQFAVENYLKGYLLKNGIDVAPYKTIDTLYKECVRINKRFEKVNLNEFTCQRIESGAKYCNEVPKVSHCFHAANHLDTFLREENVL